mmetsp:Transcript_17896/g.50671  ORF Transcript_17896/g.50671 Transcript_17896/m.50671 type:complete len:201 (+) Transcript_17896:393-995(+)
MIRCETTGTILDLRPPCLATAVRVMGWSRFWRGRLWCSGPRSTLPGINTLRNTPRRRRGSSCRRCPETLPAGTTSRQATAISRRAASSSLLLPEACCTPSGGRATTRASPATSASRTSSSGTTPARRGGRRLPPCRARGAAPPRPARARWWRWARASSSSRRTARTSSTAAGAGLTTPRPAPGGSCRRSRRPGAGRARPC